MRWRSSARDILAEIVILLATLSFACATIFGLRLSDYDPMVVAAGSLLFGGMLLLPASLIVDHPWTLRPTPQALAATVTMGIFSSAFGLMLFYMCLIAARHAHHQCARLFAHSDRRRPFGAAARRIRAVKSRARPGPGHGRRRRHDHPGRPVQALAKNARAIWRSLA